MLFGDAAGAAILEAADDEGEHLVDISLHLDGEQWEAIHIPKGGSRERPRQTLDEKDYMVSMNGREVFKFAVRALASATHDILERNKLKASDIKCVVAHQANMRIIEAVTSRVDIPIDRWVINLDKCGNTSSASALMALDEARRNELVKPGEYALMLAIGAGLAWSAALYKA